MRKKFILRQIRNQFECQRCNLCCKVPGFVFLSHKEAGVLARYLKLSKEEFFEKYCTKEDAHLVLKDQEDGSCIFLSEQGCTVHEAKPKQCRTFPMEWRDEDAYDYCEGILKIKNETTLNTTKA